MSTKNVTDSELQHVRSPEPLTFSVLRVRNVRGQRGDTVNTLVKVEFGEKTLGESPKVECKAEEPAEINYHTTVNVTFEDGHSLEEIANKPILCTVIEVLPKEKKQKEEKTVVLGQCTVDLLPLLQDEVKHNYTLPIYPLPGSPLESIPPDAPRPEVDVCISVNSALLTEQQKKEANLICLSMESLYSTPDSFTLTGQQFNYTAAIPMPITKDREQPLVFAGGNLKPGVEKEVPNRQKRWAMPAGAQGNAVYIPEKMISSDSIDDEDGELKEKENREHRHIAEQDKNRVTWNIERRTYLDAGACKSLQEKIAKTRYWPVEVVRTPQAAQGKGAKGKEDDSHVSFHGVVYLNLAPLLYPGVKRIRGAYKVHAYTDQDLTEKTDRISSIADEAVRIGNGILNRTGASPFPKPGRGKDGDKKDVKKGPSGVKASDTGSEGQPEVVNAEGQQYVESKSYMIIEINLQRPLVPKRPPEELAKRVAEYIPPRPKFPKRTDGAQRAVEDYHGQIGVVANMILDEFRDSFGDGLSNGEMTTTQEGMEERKQKLLFHLNSSGKYFAFKEQLKHAVVKIVREKYLRTTNFQDKDELQHFLSELYVYLVDQMHVGLRNVLQIEDQSPIPQPLTDSAQLKHFAREAEVNGNFELASKYYQERIARNKNDPDCWLDYGTFNLYINDLTKAEECFSECVSIDQRHLHGLILYGVVCNMQDKQEKAENFFEAATSFEPKSILAWTMLGLFYDGIGNEIGTEMALLEANKLNVDEAKAQAKEARLAREAQQKQEASALSPAHEVPLLEGGGETAVASGETGGAGGVSVQAGDETEAPADTASAQKVSSPTHSQLGSDGRAKAGSKAERRPSARKSEKKLVKSRRQKSVPKMKPAALSARAVTKLGSKIKASRLRSNENLSRPGSQSHARSPSLAPAPTDGATTTEGGASSSEQGGASSGQEPTPVPDCSIFMQIIEFLLEVKAMPFAERTLAHHLLDPLGGPSARYYICLARLKLQRQAMEEAQEALKEALQFDHQHPDAWALMGHVKYMLGEHSVAKDCYERTLDFVSDASEMHSIYLRLASIYLQESKFEKARNTFLMACKRSPSCVAWLGVGIACFRLGELSEAEDALAEANVLNNSDPEVWAYLSLVCLRTGRQLEAEQAYKYAVKLNLQDKGLLEELHAVQEEVGFGNPQL